MARVADAVVRPSPDRSALWARRPVVGRDVGDGSDVCRCETVGGRDGSRRRPDRTPDAGTVADRVGRELLPDAAVPLLACVGEVVADGNAGGFRTGMDELRPTSEVDSGAAEPRWET